MTVLQNLLNSDLMSYAMLILRIIVPFIALFIIWRCYTSFKKGLRLNDPVIMLQNVITAQMYPVLYWENSIGRSKSCDIVIDDPTVSRDHAVLMRRNEGWIICDTDSTSGVEVNGKKVDDKKILALGDRIVIGRTCLELCPSALPPRAEKKIFRGFTKNASSPFSLMVLTTLVELLITLQLVLGTGELLLIGFAPFAVLFLINWTFYFISTVLLKRSSFEIETVGLLLSGIGILLLSGEDLQGTLTQIMALLIGITLFMFLIWFMEDLDRVMKSRIIIAILAVALFAFNIIFGKEINGSKNWIYIASYSFQPSELIKIAFIFVGASTLDRLQTKKNLAAFIGFTAVCMVFLFVMRDFGTACIFFATFMIIAFMRSGSIRTMALIIAVAVLGAVMIIYFKPYVAERFAGWHHIWEHINDSQGYQQTRVLTYIASGGWFGMGLGKGYLHFIAAGDSDLVFGMLTEEQGLIMSFAVVFAIILFVFYTRADVTRSRSTFYSITSCAAAGLLLFQALLNIFGATDVLPMTGVTLPFISAGGSSLLSVWGLIAFIKASDERTYAAKRIRKEAQDNEN
jgi:cell division protein FtsW